jgi:hypothetical protein
MDFLIVIAVVGVIGYVAYKKGWLDKLFKDDSED